MSKTQTVYRQNVVKMKYIKTYIKAGSTFPEKAKDIGKICRLNINIYPESSLYIK